MKTQMSQTIKAKSILALSTMLLANFAIATSKYQVNKYQCKNVTSEIAEIDNKLRAGYSVKRGEELKAELRKLKSIKYTCKQKGLPTTSDE